MKLKNQIPKETPLEHQVWEAITKSIVAAFPFIGGSINSLVSDYQARRKQDRLKEFCLGLQEDIVSLKDIMNQDYVKSDDFLDIFEETARNIVNERTLEKRIAFKNILLNSSVQEDIDYDYTEENLRLLSRLRNEHLYFIKLFGAPRTINEQRGRPLDDGGGFSTSISQLLKALVPEWSADKIVDICSDLENERLLRGVVGSFRTMMTDQGITHLENRLTKKGYRFHGFISNPSIEK